MDPGTFKIAMASVHVTRTSSAIPPTIMPVDIANTKAWYDEQERLYWQFQGIEQALCNQIKQAIEADYLQALRNPLTQMVDVSIPEIIEYLQDSQGHITEQELSDQEDKLKRFVYNARTPVGMVFNKITWYQDQCKLSKNTKTDCQLVQLAHIIFNRTRVFMDMLLEWNKKNVIDKMCNDFLKIYTCCIPCV